jgi:AcrR family transcriptional regulator
LIDGPARPGETAARQPPRKRRVDAERNRDRLLEAAKAAFTEAGAEASLDDIARQAGVGIGTLYRHFPTRAALLEAVYRREVERLADAAPRLLQALPSDEALRAWMLMFVDYIATKKLIAPALAASAGGKVFASLGQRINEAIGTLVEGARRSGAIRSDANPDDLLRALVGFAYVQKDADWQASARRLIGILMDGLRVAP